MKTFVYKKYLHLLAFHPGLALPSLQTTQLLLQQVNLTWVPDPIENRHLLNSQLHKNTWARWPLTLSLQYGHVILANGYLVLTGINWPLHGCSICNSTPRKFQLSFIHFPHPQEIPVPSVGEKRYFLELHSIKLKDKDYKSLCQPFSWSMAAILLDSVVVCMHPWAILLAMMVIRKSIHGFPSILYGYGALLGGPSGHQGSTVSQKVSLMKVLKECFSGLSCSKAG